VAAIIDLRALRPNDANTQAMLDRMPKHMMWHAPLERERNRVRIIFVGLESDDGLVRVRRALEGAATELGVDWSDYFTVAQRL
jgi:hypothetical protein